MIRGLWDKLVSGPPGGAYPLHTGAYMGEQVMGSVLGRKDTSGTFFTET